MLQILLLLLFSVTAAKYKYKYLQFQNLCDYREVISYASKTSLKTKFCLFFIIL